MNVIDKELDKFQESGIRFLKDHLIRWKRLLSISSKQSTLDFKKLVRLIMRSILNITRTRRGFLLLFNKNKDLNLQIQIGFKNNEFNDDEYSISRTLTGEVIKSKKIIVIDNVGNSEFRNTKSIIDLNLKAIMCIPLLIKNKLIGLIYIDTDNPEHSLSVEDMDIFKAFASQAAISIQNALLHKRLKDNFHILKKTVREKYSYEHLIGQSEEMKKVTEKLNYVLDNDIPVFLNGETGTGKELIAKTIHVNSNRKNKNFISLNCGALPNTLLESELFGYKKGAFTGANEDKAGIFEKAHGGTLFLDEIGEATAEMQIRLLRFLEDKLIRKLGDTKEIRVDTRIICATNKDLEQECNNKNFRRDLLYRLNIFPIVLPPLRKRKKDIPLLIDYFIAGYNKKLNKNVDSVPRELMKIFLNKEWAGNIRELKNTIYRLMVQSRTCTLAWGEFREEQIHTITKIKNLYIPDQQNQFKPLAEMEKAYIEIILGETNQNQVKAAKILGLNRSTLRARMRKLGLL